MKTRLGICAAIVLIAAGFGIREVKASPQNLPVPCVVVVPSDWGEFKGISKDGMVFEDMAGTLRLIDQMPCSIDRGLVSVPRVTVEIRRK